jgi:hypothetical protein
MSIGNKMQRMLFGASLIAAMSALAIAAPGTASVGDKEVTIDFTSYGSDSAFDPNYYRGEGIRFPAKRCGTAGCDQWYVAWVQGDDALSQTPSLGPIQGTFTRPVSDLTLRIAPSVQGTAMYTLTAFGPSGEVLAQNSVTVTQDFGDPANTGFGYFTLSVTDLPRPAKSFTLDNAFVRSSFGNTEIPYAVSSITYVHWGRQV